MGGMPLLDTSKWVHEVNWLYMTLVPTYIWINNFLGPKVMEPVFCKDFLLAQFDKLSSGQKAEGKAVTFTPTPGKAPKLPSKMFTRSYGTGIRGRALSLGFAGIFALTKIEQ